MAIKKSITYRWIVYGFSVIAAVLLIIAAVCVVLVSGYYREQTKQVLSGHAQAYKSAVQETLLAENWERTAVTLAENFENKQQMELQILSVNGKVLASSTGFISVGQDAVEDFTYAKAVKQMVVRENRSATGEHIMALTDLQFTKDGKIIGALRYVVTLRLVDRQVLSIAVGVGVVVLLVLGFCALSGLYFIRSIVHPVEEIGGAARRIAKGEYSYRVKKYTDDELGDLCDTINYMASEIQYAEQLKNEFISSVSHELRTPLTAIRGWTETLQTAGAEDPALQEKGMQIIATETDRLSGMVEELLDFSRMQDGKLTLRFETVNIAYILEETVLLFREQAEKKRIALQYVGQGELPEISGDPDRLRQVFINILDNAIKYSEIGDTVRIDYAKMQDAVQVVIGDTGLGIAIQHLSEIKQKFYQVDSNRPGSGIGLAVADEIIKGHGGSLDLHSKQGLGTSVIITLPLHQ